MLGLPDLGVPEMQHLLCHGHPGSINTHLHHLHAQAPFEYILIAQSLARAQFAHNDLMYDRLFKVTCRGLVC